jgi:hypothetical protein
MRSFSILDDMPNAAPRSRDLSRISAAAFVVKDGAGQTLSVELRAFSVRKRRLPDVHAATLRASRDSLR